MFPARNIHLEGIFQPATFDNTGGYPNHTVLLTEPEFNIKSYFEDIYNIFTTQMIYYDIFNIFSLIHDQITVIYIIYIYNTCLDQL